MKTIIVAALLGLSAVATLGVPANADTFAVHGYTNHYGR